MKILVSLSARTFSAQVKAKKNSSTQQISDEIKAVGKNVKISRMPKAMAVVDKTFTLTGDIGDLVYTIAAYYDTDPDRHQLEQDWNVVFEEIK